MTTRRNHFDHIVLILVLILTSLSRALAALAALAALTGAYCIVVFVFVLLDFIYQISI